MTHRFVQCSACRAVYPASQTGPCPECGADEAPMEPWNPAGLAPDIIEPRTLTTVMIGLIELLEGADQIQSDDGRIHTALVDALELVGIEDPDYADAWSQTEGEGDPS